MSMEMTRQQPSRILSWSVTEEMKDGNTQIQSGLRGIGFAIEPDQARRP